MPGPMRDSVSHSVSVPLKSSSALSSTSSSGLCRSCSNKLLAALSDVKISFSCSVHIHNRDKDGGARRSE